MKYFFVFFLLVIIVFPINVQATSDTDNLIGSYYIPGYVVNKKEGLLIQLHNEIINRAQLSLDLIVEPTQRIQQSFKNNQLIGYFPELWQHIPKDKSEVVVSDNIAFKALIIFTKNKGKTITQFSDLEGLTIGAVRGFSYGQMEENTNIKIQYVSSDEQNVKKLLSGRIDAMIGDSQSTVLAVKSLDHNQEIFYNTKQAIDILDIFYVFQKTPQGIAIRDKVNIAIKSLKKEGKIKLDPKTGKTQYFLP